MNDDMDEWDVFSSFQASGISQAMKEYESYQGGAGGSLVFSPEEEKDWEETTLEWNQMFSKMSSSSPSMSAETSKEPAPGTYSIDCCMNCQKDTLVHEDGMVVCLTCGVDNGPIIDYNQEWRYYGADDGKSATDPNRCGMPSNPLLPESALSTVILNSGKYGNKFMFCKLHRWSSMTYRERALLNVYQMIQHKGETSHIPTCIVDRAKILYKMLSEDKVKRGTSRKGLIAACIYYALKDENILKSDKEISHMFDLKQKKFTLGCKQFRQLIFQKNPEYSAKMEPITAEEYIDRYSKLLYLEPSMIESIKKIAAIAEQLGILAENTPPSIAVGCLYFTMHCNRMTITKKELSKICDNISEVTISKAFKKLSPYESFFFEKGKESIASSSTETTKKIDTSITTTTTTTMESELLTELTSPATTKQPKVGTVKTLKLSSKKKKSM
jgi:transcription initiation factor TFIIB